MMLNSQVHFLLYKKTRGKLAENSRKTHGKLTEKVYKGLNTSNICQLNSSCQGSNISELTENSWKTHRKLTENSRKTHRKPTENSRKTHGKLTEKVYKGLNTSNIAS